MKVLLTGCTAQQASPAAHNRIPTFAGLVHKALVSQGAEVVWTEPSMEMDRDFITLFDRVIVGLVSPGSLVAHYIYPALSVAEVAFRTGRLVLMADAPEPHNLWAGLTSAGQNEGSLVKDFYARRKDFARASESETYSRLQGFVEALTALEWPLTLAPALPWSPEGVLDRHIPNLPPELALELSFDQGLELPLPTTIIEPDPREVWVADAPTSQWTKQVRANISLPIEPLRSSRRDSAADLAERVRASLGTLVTAYRGREPWWTPVVRLSLLQGTPVVSEWRHTSRLGEPWSHLATYVESLDLGARRELAREQEKAYVASLPEFSSEASRLMQTLDTLISV